MSKRRSSASASSSPFSAASIVLFSLFVLLPNVFFFLGKATATAAAESIVNEERDIRIFNHAGVKIELYWINPDTREGHLMTVAGVGLYHGAQMPLQSFVGHEFEVRELPSIETGRCGGANRKSSSNDNNEDNGNSMEGQCQIGTFIVTRYDDQVITVNPGMEVVLTDTFTSSQSKASDIVASCRQALQNTLSQESSALDPLKSFGDCVANGVTQELSDATEEVTFQAQIRTSMADLLENYTCLDDNAPTTPEIRTEIWTSREEQHLVYIQHERPDSQIHVISNFITEDECLAVEKEAAKTLHIAAVADGKGGSEYSKNRKAMQAGIVVEWEKEKDGDLIAQLSRRVYDYTNHVLNLNIQEHGQEELMSIQYFGRGRNDTEPDRYMPHCDGDCTGLPHKIGTRMATMVMYCNIPEEGGATNFRNAGVHIQPEVGNAIFFSYMNPITKIMDTGFTEHSGCPVFEGEKKIVTQWIRYGVDDDNPWDSYNTLGVKYSEENDF